MSEMALELIARAKRESWTRLDLGNCEILGTIPWQIKDLTALKELTFDDSWYWKDLGWKKYLSVNKGRKNIIKYLPETFPPNIERFSISNNFIEDISPLSQLRNLEQLSIRGNPVKDVSALINHGRINALDIHGTEVKSLNSIRNLRSLVFLDIGNTLVASLAPISKLKSLEELYASNTDICSLWDIRNLLELKILDVSGTLISKVDHIEKLSRLEVINLSRTQVSDISNLESLCRPRWKVLRGRGREIFRKDDVSNETLPMRGNLRTNNASKFSSRLKRIDIKGTKVKDLSPLAALFINRLKLHGGYETLENGVIVDLDRIENPPTSILVRGDFAVASYFEELFRVGTYPATDIKFFLLGNTNAGKSTLRHALIHQEYSEAISSTHGAELHESWPNGDETLHLWDFGGQEYFHATHRLFLSSNSLYAVIADPNFNQGGYHKTLIKHFGETEPREEELEHFHHDYWLEMVQRVAPQGRVMMVWNKLDQEKTEKHSLTDGEKQRFEKAGQIHEYFQSPQAALQAESPKWKAQWEALRQDILEAAKKLLKDQKVIRYWPQVREAIEERSKTDLWISWEEFVRICMDDDPLRELGNIIIYLRDMCGAILYWDVDGLRDQVFINPNKINQLIYAVLDRTVQQAQGRFTRSHAETQVAMALAQLHGADAQTQGIPATAETLLRVMRQFEIIFEVVAGTGEYVAPQYLSRVEPETVKAAKEFAGLKPSFFLRFRSYIPRHLVPMFIARKGLLAVGRNYWKHGIVFKENGVNACLEVDYDGGMVQVSIENPDSNLAVQRLIFAAIREISDLDTAMEVSTDGKSFVRYTELLKAEGMGNPRCESLQGTPMEVSKMAVFLNRIPVALEIDPKPPIVKTHIHICFADGDRAAYNNLEKYLEIFAENFNFSYWSRAALKPGQVKHKQIEQEIAKANAIIFLTSIDLIAGKGDTQYDYDLSLQKVEAGNALAVPILISSVAHMDKLPLGKYPFPLGVGAVDLATNPAQTWQVVIEWIFQVLEQRDQVQLDHPKKSIDPDLVSEMANKVNAILQGTDRIASKVDAIKEGNDRIEKRLDVEFNRIMNKLHDGMDFQNEVYQNLMMLGEHIDARVEESQEQWAELHGQLETALNEAIGKLSKDNAAKVDEILALLAPSEELSKGRKFLKSIKLKLPVIAVTVALLAGGAPVATAALVAALSRSIEYETTADGVFQRLIQLLRNPGAPMLPMGQS